MNVRREPRGALLASDANTLCELLDLVRRGEEKEAVRNRRLEGMANSTHIDLELWAKPRGEASDHSEPLGERRGPFLLEYEQWGGENRRAYRNALSARRDSDRCVFDRTLGRNTMVSL